VKADDLQECDNFSTIAKSRRTECEAGERERQPTGAHKIFLNYRVVLWVFQTNGAQSGGYDDNYMASVQSLSALADNPTMSVTASSFPAPAAPLSFRDQSPAYGQLTAGDGVAAYWHQNWSIQPQRPGIHGYSTAENSTDWYSCQPNAQQYSQQYVNGFGQRVDPSSWNRRWSARYHPYATNATAATGRPDSVDVAAFSMAACRYPYNAADQRASNTAPSYSLGAAAYDLDYQMAYGGPQLAAYPAMQQSDYVTADYSNYQMSSDHF